MTHQSISASGHAEVVAVAHFLMQAAKNPCPIHDLAVTSLSEATGPGSVIVVD